MAKSKTLSEAERTEHRHQDRQRLQAETEALLSCRAKVTWQGSRRSNGRAREACGGLSRVPWYAARV
jgi:hypothetical protein